MVLRFINGCFQYILCIRKAYLYLYFGSHAKEKPFNSIYNLVCINVFRSIYTIFNRMYIFNKVSFELYFFLLLILDWIECNKHKIVICINVHLRAAHSRHLVLSSLVRSFTRLNCTNTRCCQIKFT